ncbi:THUMP domain-containing protein [Archaeoglobus veneficus]|uniref:THUMP domain-containing protein n=1 Tax=Archaeoglobus veneficus (strain DSM 11195 / SNP6) TaxID=693661 RepID=F2KP81_ARCVS|nr:THUMP domain-containing protein [Archaeoglobus veneficus]AEA47485.1 THUMP domain-containing protein [Archaeoglobus veneficus SNP6]
MDVVIVRYGELGLKGKLRRRFEDILVGNIKRVMKVEGFSGEISREWGRIYIHSDSEELARRVAKIFGVVSTSVAAKCRAELDEIAELAVTMAGSIERSFAVRARRAGVHDFTSMDVAKTAGKAIKEATGAKVNLENPDVEIFIEVRDDVAYVYTAIFRGYGGLPVGTQERVLAVGNPLAAWYALRRGCDVDVESEEKAELLRPWACYRRINVVPIEGSTGEKLSRAFDMNYPGIFCSLLAHELSEYIDLLKKRKMPVFMPLLPFTPSEVEEKIREIWGGK